MNGELSTIFAGDGCRCVSKMPLAERVQPNFFVRERDNVFRRSWLVAASTTDLAENGSYITTDIARLRVSLLIVRKRGWHRPRVPKRLPLSGDRLVHTTKGCARAFTCAFHARS